jgi:hypothetical protein
MVSDGYDRESAVYGNLVGLGYGLRQNDTCVSLLPSGNQDDGTGNGTKTAARAHNPLFSPNQANLETPPHG